MKTSIVMYFVFGGCSMLAASDYCSLKVRVLSPTGQRVESSIYVTESRGRVVEAEQEQSDAEFCDLGILPVTVSVGEEKSCGQVTVKNVRLALNQPRLLTVTYDVAACRKESVPSPTPNCLILVRVADTSDHWIPGAIIHSDLSAAQNKADSAGRAAIRIGIGSRATMSITASGFNSSSSTVACTAETAQQEKVIVLTRP
jgi:hypothetical protein